MNRISEENSFNFRTSPLLYLLTSILLSIMPLTNTVKANSTNSTDHIKKGDYYYSKFQNMKALKEYKLALELDLDNYEILIKLARANNDVGEDLNSDESEIYYEKAVYYAERLKELFPDSAKTYYYLAGSYGNLALFKGGKDKVKLSQLIESNANRAIKLDPDLDPAYLILGIYYREVADLSWVLKFFAETFFGNLPEGTFENAVTMLLKAIELNPTYIQHHYQLAKTYEIMDEDEKAIEYYKKVLELPATDHLDHRKIDDSKEKLNDF